MFKIFAGLIVVTVTTLGLIGCDQVMDQLDATVTADGEIDLNANVMMTEAKQVNGIIYVQDAEWCIAIDAANLYPDQWMELPAFDAFRVADYTAEEAAECGR